MTHPRPFREAVFSLETSEDVIALITITDPSWDDDLRFSTHREERFGVDPLREGTTSNGLQYEYRALAASYPDDADGSLPTFMLIIENVEQDLGYLADEDLGEARVTMTLVLRTDPDAVIEELPDFEIVNNTLSEDKVALECSLDPIEQQGSPSYKFTPQYCPGLFR